MSWSMAAAGKSADVAASFARQVQYQITQGHNGEAARHIIEAHGAIVALHCSATPEKMLLAESSGHLDTSSGSSSLVVRCLYSYPE